MAALAGVIRASTGPGADSPLSRMLHVQRHRGTLRASARVELAEDVAAEIGCLHPASRTGAFASRGGCVLACDGFVSNAAELRAVLAAEAIDVSRATPAELLLEALVRWGGDAFARIHGSWALVFADPVARRIWLARDPLGSKPLYVSSGAQGCFFASEIKAILEGTQARFAIDPEVVGGFLEHSLLDARPQTFFSGIRAVPAGHAIALDGTRRAPGEPEPVAFWRIPERDGFSGSGPQRIAAVRERLLAAVHRQLGDEERIGLLVSGGVDSSSVAAAACAASGDRELVLVSGGDPRRRDPMLDALCRHLGREAQRFSMLVPAPSALRDLEAVIGFNDEPVRGFDLVAEHRLKEAAQGLGVRVLMGGLGSDEVFSGKLLHLVFHLQSLLRSRRLLEAARVVAGVARRRTLRPRFRVAVQKRYFPALDRNPIDVGGPLLRAHRRRHDLGLGPGDCHERLMREITQLSLPALLHYDDRTSSTFGLENRYAFLDPPLVELVAPMPAQWKLRDGFPKWLLRKAMEPLLPREICWRKVTQSAGDAYGDWLKNELRPSIQDLLRGDLASVELGLLDADGVRRHYAAFCRQRPDRGAISAHEVFNWIAIELWARRFAPHLRADAAQ